MKIDTATIGDAEELLALQKTAFHREAVFYDNFSITPLMETIDTYRTSFNEFTILKAIIDSRIIGSVRANTVGTTCYISRLVVLPVYQRQGIAGRLMRAIEKRLGDEVERLELFTGAKSEGNIALYVKLGYRVFRTTENDGITMVLLEKRRERRTS